MVDFNHDELIISSSPRVIEDKRVRALYVGGKEFLTFMPSENFNVAMELKDDPLELVDNWYGQTKNHFIAEVMDRGLRMRPDVVVFNYPEFFSSDLSPEAIEVVVKNVKSALNCGFGIAIVYRKLKNPEAPERLGELFPELRQIFVH